MKHNVTSTQPVHDSPTTPPATVYLALGSNLGDRLAHLHAAIAALEKAVHIDAVSSVYETAPAYVTDQPRFFNLVLRGTTHHTPHDLLHVAKDVEQRVGRTTTFRHGPRVVDIDILLYADQQIHMPNLIVPHPRIVERAFVLVPLAELAPDLIVPGQHEPVHTLAQRAAHGEILACVAAAK